MTMTYTGGAMLWVGWLAFCGGCALAANGFSMMVMLNTMLGGAAATLGWMLTEMVRRKKASTFGVISATIAGLVAVNPRLWLCQPGGRDCPRFSDVAFLCLCG